MKPKSAKIAYALLTFLGLQGGHQFYLGNWKRGLLILLPIHVPWPYLAYWAHKGEELQQAGEQIPLEVLPYMILALIVVLFGLSVFAWDIFTLHKQIKKAGIQA